MIVTICGWAVFFAMGIFYGKFYEILRWGGTMRRDAALAALADQEETALTAKREAALDAIAKLKRFGQEDAES